MQLLVKTSLLYDDTKTTDQQALGLAGFYKLKMLIQAFPVWRRRTFCCRRSLCPLRENRSVSINGNLTLYAYAADSRNGQRPSARFDSASQL